jgi:AmiR/NasT family two-component response regulator
MDDETAFRWLRRESMRRRLTVERVAEELATAPDERPSQARTS